jgi:ABC-type multidrug transport system fused ATPase/permease subunit
MVTVNGSVAYAAQKPCIMSGTVRENILFGAAYDKKRFE